jgi:non-specific serine/threonine protein kinase
VLLFMVSERSSARAFNLPLEIKSFVGRRRELGDARRLLGESRLLTLVGVGGVGKTRLALRLAAMARRTFPDGVWLAEFAPLADGDLVPQAVIAALGLRDQSARQPTDTLLEYLVDKQMLLVFDNCEHLLDACGALAARLLSEVAGVRILATSRESLNIGGEQVLEVPPLSVPGHDVVGASVLTYEAVGLFADRAAAVVPEFAVTAGNCAAVARLCRQLDGIPLAVELAAVRLRALSVEQILERLDDRFHLLTRGTRMSLPRHQTLKATIDWSFDLCPPRERMLWARLSVFAGGFDLEAAEQVCADEDIAQEDMCVVLAGLVDKSILACEHEENGMQVRYRLLETIRQYGRDRLAESGQERRIQQRHRDFYRRLALRAEAGFFGPEQAKWLARLRPDLPNVRVALDSCLADPDQIQPGLLVAGALLHYWIFYGLLGEARQWLVRALQLDPEPTVVRSKALAAAAHIALLQGDVEAASAMCDETVAVARRLSDGRALAHAAHISGMTAWAHGDFRDGIPLLVQALERSRTDGDDPNETFMNLLFLSMATALHGDERSAAYSAETLAAACGARAELMIAWATWARGLHHWARGDIRQATEMFQDSLRLHRTFQNLWGYGWCTEALAWIEAADDRYERAARLLGATQTLLRSIGGLGGFQLFADAHHRSESRIRDALGEDAFAAAARQGSELTLEETLDYALGTQISVPKAAHVPFYDATRILTPREHQVAGLIAEGLSNKQIAAKLVIAKSTAEAHVANILSKLGFTSRTQVAYWLSVQSVNQRGPAKR